MVVLTDNWKKYPQNFDLPKDEVHVWRASLHASMVQVAYLRYVLSDDEIRRANRYYFCQHQRNFIVGRGLLRIILGRYLDITADKLFFEYNKRGKPELANKCNKNGINFNLSHSGGILI